MSEKRDGIVGRRTARGQSKWTVAGLACASPRTVASAWLAAAWLAGAGFALSPRAPLVATSGEADATGDAGADSAGSALFADVEYGAHPERFGFKLLVSGAEPFARGLLALEGKGVAQPVRLAIQLDGDGAWERVWRDVPLDGAVHATFAATVTGGVAVSNKVKVQKLATQSPSPLQRRAVLVREVMKDPVAVSDSKGEWIEIVNLTSKPIDLQGWTLDDGGSNHHVIGGSAGTSIWLQPQVPFVLGINADPATNGGMTVDYKYSSFSLNNTSDVIALFAPSGALVDWVAYDDGIFWPDAPGKSLTLRPTCLEPSLADDGGYWCDASSPLGAGGDFGTPQAANDVCP